MNIDIDKNKIVSGIQHGLANTKTEIYTSNTLTDNRKHMEKWDNICTSVKNVFSDNDSYDFIPLDRGLFKPVMIYDKNSKTLYTIIKKQNYNKLLSRKSIQKSHYMDAMLDYNIPYQSTSTQLSLFEFENFVSDNAESQITDLKTKIETILNTNEIQKYITIVIDFTGYVLTDVRAVLCSKWLNEIESESWTEYIVPSYDDIEENGKTDNTQNKELKTKIAIKPVAKGKADLA